MSRGPIKILVAVTYLLMVAVNVLASTLPINGVQTGDVADSYPNLFTPAGVTFSIWGVIYLLLALHVLYQLGLFQASDGDRDHQALLNKVGLYFSISSLANTAWVFAWHYDRIAVAAVLITVILVCLIAITRTVLAANPTTRDRLFVGLPFSVYFGWSTVATVANITVLLDSLGWDGFGLAESTWAVIIILVAMAIGTATMLRNRDVAYGLVLIWAYIGILIKHTSDDGFAGKYSTVIGTVIACLVVFLAAEALILVRRRRSPALAAEAHIG